MFRIIFTILILKCTLIYGMAPKLNWEKAIDNAIVRYGLQTEPHLISLFSKADVAYPPKNIALLAFKKERYIELWAKSGSEQWHYIHNYPLTAFSGNLGPKLRENDGQIPEGIYHLTSFNPFSNMHLSMMIDYPNQFDQAHAKQDGRRKLGNNIFLHGKASSVGCLAIGNKAIDQLFLLVRRVGLSNVQVVIAPNDLRRSKAAIPKPSRIRWLPELYRQISSTLRDFPLSRKRKMLAAQRKN